MQLFYDDAIKLIILLRRFSTRFSQAAAAVAAKAALWSQSPPMMINYL
jgi:hypothetical protein